MSLLKVPFFRYLFTFLVAACSLGSVGLYILQPFLFSEARLYAGDWSAVWEAPEESSVEFSEELVSRDEEQVNRAVEGASPGPTAEATMDALVETADGDTENAAVESTDRAAVEPAVDSKDDVRDKGVPLLTSADTDNGVSDGGDGPENSGSEDDLTRVAATLEGMIKENGEGAEPDPPPLAYTAAGVLRDKHTGAVLTGLPFTVRASIPGAAGSAIEAEVDAASGTFRLSDLAFGRYLVVAEAEGYLPCWSELAVPLTGEQELLLEQSCCIRVRVTDDHARRVRGVVFTAHALNPGVQNPDGLQELSTTQEGRYHVVKGLRPGKQQLQVKAEGFEGLVMEVLVERDETRSYWVVLKN